MIEEELWEDLLKNVEPDESLNIYDLSVGNFIEMLNDGEFLYKYFQKRYGETEFKKIASGIKGFQESSKNLFTYLEKFNIEEDEDQKKSARGIDFPSFFENILTDCVDYFHLHSIDEAENTKLSGWFMMKKRELAKQKLESNYNKLLDAKYKK